jgi:short-subunit dehydrogenase
MDYKKWLNENTESLSGKTVAVTGTTGGLGKELCDFIASLGARLILMDRNKKRSEAHRDELKTRHGCDVECINVDLEDINSVKGATGELLSNYEPDIFIHNAGAYSIPRKKCDTGMDNVFQINFVSPYYMIRKMLPELKKRGGRVIVVGSIAHNYSKIDVRDVDFATRKQASKVYGNAKRYLMFSLYELFKNEENVTLSVTHPGITFTNITAHYPKVIFALIKHPMKVIFMKPKKAALCIVKGVFDGCGLNEWIGPRLFNVWGLPKKQSLKTCPEGERLMIAANAEQIYANIK